MADGACVPLVVELRYAFWRKTPRGSALARFLIYHHQDKSLDVENSEIRTGGQFTHPGFPFFRRKKKTNK